MVFFDEPDIGGWCISFEIPIDGSSCRLVCERYEPKDEVEEAEREPA